MNTPALVQVNPTTIAVVRQKAAAAQLSQVVPAGCGAAWKFAKDRGLKAGHNVAVYWDDAITVEAGVEVEGDFEGAAGIVRSATPAGRAVTITHYGPYQKLGAAHDAIHDWARANNVRLMGPRWEVYGHWVAEWNTNPSLIRTDVFYQVAS